MKKTLFFILFCITLSSQGQNMVQKMYKNHAKNFRKSLSFVQQTTLYRGDSIFRKDTWYEVLVYPDKLRIDINDAISGNAMFFVNDSSFRFINNNLKIRVYQPHDLLFVLGGMYSYPLDTVYNKLKRFGYNSDKFYDTIWKGQPVTVVGTDKDENESNQFWVDKEKMVVVRILNNKNGQKSEIICEDYIKLGNHWCETKIEFSINGKLIQAEKYTDLKENVNVDPDYLNPYKMGKVKFWNN